ncbi:MAG TPA: hypothetical protein VF490_20915, partial [Chryseosolibacter sp.]
EALKKKISITNGTEPTEAPPLPAATAATDVPEARTFAAAVSAAAPVRDAKTRSASRTPSLSSLLKSETKTESNTDNAAGESALNEPFSELRLQEIWSAYAEQKKHLPAEYQLLSQPYRLAGNAVIVELLSPVHETMLNAIRTDLTAFLREKLRNSNIHVSGELHTGAEKKVIYTNREKFDFLAEKNPVLRELKERLGLDTDF